jgi:hypothetical protein
MMTALTWHESLDLCHHPHEAICTAAQISHARLFSLTLSFSLSLAHFPGIRSKRTHKVNIILSVPFLRLPGKRGREKE